MTADLVFASAFVHEQPRAVANLPVDEIVHGAEVIDSPAGVGAESSSWEMGEVPPPPRTWLVIS